MITIKIINGPTIDVNFTAGMNGQMALEGAFNQVARGELTYSLQYYGSSLGYLVNMINETYDTFMSQYQPFYFWEFLVNGIASPTGIDNTQLNDNDVITFEYTTYSSSTTSHSTLHSKMKAKRMESY